MRSLNPVLLIEDNPEDAQVTLNALAKHYFVKEVVIARDGAEALELLFGEAKLLPELVLLSVSVPRVSALETLERIKSDERTKLIPVVMLTSSHEDIAGSVRKPTRGSQMTHR